MVGEQHGVLVCKLQKAIYGLKQSPRTWFEKFSQVLLTHNLSRCHSDHSMFVRFSPRGVVILVVYVNDILSSGCDAPGIEMKKRLVVEKRICNEAKILLRNQNC